MKNRSRGQFGRGGPQRPAPPENPDDRIVLTGIIQQGADGVAFFEDTRSRKTIRVQAGDAVGRGRATAVTLDEVQYACDGTTTKVAVGSNLTGRATALSSPAAPLTPAAPPTAGMRPGGPPMGGPPTAGPSGPAVATAAAPPVVIVVGAEESTDDETASDSTEQPPAAGPPAAGNPGASMDNSAASILERMRQRREQELQK